MPEMTTATISSAAWALMPNHVHLLIRTGDVPIATLMRRLLTGYAVRFNRKYRRHGSLFQNRYKSILCQEEPYLLELVRYIHLNPLRAGIVGGMPELDAYPYTSHSAIMGRSTKSWQDTYFVPAHFAKAVDRGRELYREYVEQGVGRGRPDLVGGGFRRSSGSWIEPAGENRVRPLPVSGLCPECQKRFEEE